MRSPKGDTQNVKTKHNYCTRNNIASNNTWQFRQIKALTKIQKQKVAENLFKASLHDISTQKEQEETEKPPAPQPSCASRRALLHGILLSMSAHPYRITIICSVLHVHFKKKKKHKKKVLIVNLLSTPKWHLFSNKVNRFHITQKEKIARP